MKLIILSGPPGAGKSTISMLYAKKKANCARIDTDDIRQMIVSPHKAPWEGEEGKRQLLIGVNNTCLLANQFLESDFDVIIADFVTNRTYPIYKELLQKHNPYFIRLFPNFEETKKRFDFRSKGTTSGNITNEEFRILYDMQTKFNSYDLAIDNSLLSIEEVTNQLLRL